MRRSASIEARDISWSAGGRLLVDGVSCLVRPASLVGIVGPNGAGKTSFLRCVARLLPRGRGVVLIGGADIARWSRGTTARAVGVVLQEASTEANPLVWEVVLLGRTPHGGLFEGEGRDDDAIARRALEHVGMLEFANRRWQTLSGGEHQRVHIARALAQDTSVLLLDEPTNHLDIKQQMEMMALLGRLAITSIVVLHDLNLAAMFCDELLVMKSGRLVAGGPTAEVLTPALIRDVYDVEADVLTNTATKRPVVVYRHESLR